MNKIKIQISKLNSTQRAKAIAQLRSSMTKTGQLPQMSAPSMTNPIQSIPQMPTMPVPTVPTVPVIPVIPMSTQSVPAGGK